MREHLILVATVLFLTGCGRETMPQSPNDDGLKQPPRAELRIGDALDEQPHLPFKIVTTYDRQKPSADAPYHVDGGEWTFLDCQAIGAPVVAFTVGVAARSSDGKTPAAWGKAVLIVKDRQAGSQFVEFFAKVFSGKLPTHVSQARGPVPLHVNTAILGEGMHREQGGGFSAAAGEWTATKWFPDYEGLSGEVYFNYSLSERRGEFSEKDADYADDLVAILAAALRDGPRPERTPENDVNMTRTGPALGKSRKLLPRMASYYGFSPKALFAAYQDRSLIFIVPLDQPIGSPREFVRFDHSPWEVRLLNDELDFIVQEGVPEFPGMRSSGDPMRIWWVDGKTGVKKLLRGPEKDLNLAEGAVSPDLRYVTLDQWKDGPRGKPRLKLLLVLDRETGEVRKCESQGKDLSLVGWRRTENGLRGVVVTNRWQIDKKEASELYLADPATGKLERQGKADARLDIDSPLSPDGKSRVRVGKEELEIIGTESGRQRRFVFHEDDRRFVSPECVEWVSPRYLKFNGPRLTLIDVTTMKMCFPASADGVKLASAAYRFGSDLRWVLYQGEGIDGEGLYLAPVEMPK